MRWWSVVCAVVIASTTVWADTVSSSNNGTVTTAVSASVLGAGDAALALREVAMLVLRATGVVALPAPSPPACVVPDDAACLQGTLRALTAGTATVAIVAVPAGAAPSAWDLRESGIQELGEITAPSRRACLATKPPARSLLDLTDSTLAAKYHIPDEEIYSQIRELEHNFTMETCDETYCNGTLTPDWCKDYTCATLLTSGDAEAKVMWREVLNHRLYATVRPLGEYLSNVSSALSSRSLIACDWAPEVFGLRTLKAETLGPPPCISPQPCPFETRRIVTFINIRELARAPSAVRALVRLDISKEDMRKLAEDAYNQGPSKAARLFFDALPTSVRTSEVRVAVLLPNDTRREIYDGRAIAAAAALAEEVLEEEWQQLTVRFKVETFDDKCHTQRAYKYMHDAPASSEFGALSALAGPACGAAWADVARQSPAHNLPLLAYTPQAPASTSHDNTDTKLQILAAGDAREAASALADFMSRQGWRRLAALSEPATRPLIDAIRLHVKLEVHVEMPENDSFVDVGVIQQWASNAAKENARIFYLCVEDARVTRAALCAARAFGLTPGAGVVWLLCNTHKADWLNSKPHENCTTRELEEMAAGHFTVTPEWALKWENKTLNVSDERRVWENRWRTHCRRLALASSGNTIACDSAPGPTIALLYDILRQWAAALRNFLQVHPTAVDDLHNLLHVKYITNNMTKNAFTGLTGPFEWTTTDGAYSRIGTTILSQWNLKIGARKVGTWAKGSLDLDNSALKWYTTDGRKPDDGSERCALQGFADILHADCRTAFVALGALLVAILILALAGTAIHCKRRAEREYRKRLQALGMRPLANKPPGLDRWEIPRERVVINRKLGTGAFGTVYGGHALLAEDRGWSAVAVKTLKAGATTEEKLDFLSEAEAMKRFDHKNVVRLLGVVTKTEPVCTVMEFMLYGDLKNYLLARRHLAMGSGEEESEGREVDEASPRRLTGMALDVARALSYLAQLRYVHRDVAARNCLVSARRVVKLADFGMTRLVFENDYYRFSRKGMLPVRWMAPESLALGVFSPASDVWSFGVLLYEIVTFGSLPFQGLSNSEVLGRVKAGHTLDLPPGLKPQLEGLIKSCWQQDPKTRPTASELAAFLADAPRLLSPCLDVPLDALPLDADPPWRLPRDQAEARWVSWAAPASAATDTTYLSTDGALPLDTDSFLP